MQLIKLTIKQAFWVMFLCFVLISFPQPSLAVMVQDVPNPQEQYVRGWVTDMANLFDVDTKLRLNQMITKFEHQNGTEIAVVTVPDTAPSATPKEFATHLFKTWGIGKKGINNGVLLLISKNDHRVEIETGYGIEKVLSNARVGEIVNQEIIPYFKQDDFAGGTIAGIQALVITLNGRELFASSSKHQPNFQALIGVLLLLVVILIFVIWAIDGVVKAMNGNNDHKLRRIGNSGDEVGGGFCSGDGGGFGGGDCGGGGDGGSW